MPAKSESQRRAAALELSRRKKGMKRQKKAARPFGSATLKQLKDFSKK